MIVLVHSGVCDARMWDGFDLPGRPGTSWPAYTFRYALGRGRSLAA